MMICTYACFMAHGTKCTCVCGGKNHGVGFNHLEQVTQRRKRPTFAQGSINEVHRKVLQTIDTKLTL